MVVLAATPWIEALVSVVIGIILLALQKQDLAEITWILGVALNFTRFAFVQKLEEEMDSVHNLASVLDLQRQIPLNQFQEMTRVYLEITESEFRPLKETIVTEAISRLQKLAQLKTSDVLSTADYYSWLFPIIKSFAPNSHIWAISTMLDVEWDDSPAEENFLTLNLEAVKRGVFLAGLLYLAKGRIERTTTSPSTAAGTFTQKSDRLARNQHQRNAWLYWTNP